jgi:aryl-phospho-beta-D-glucosidase BglC (GH1 family)
MIRALMIVVAVSLRIMLFGQITPQEAVLQMGRGINLGNTLEPPEEGGWNNPTVKEYYFDDYVAAGFKTIRIPVSWYGHTEESPPYAVDIDWMDRVEKIVDWGLSRKLFIILNAHHESWLKEDPNANHIERFDSIWSQVAYRFKNKSDSLIFEILNEPHPMLKDTVDNLNERVLSIIRKTNPTRIVAFSGHMWSNAEELITARIPNDDYLLGYFHSYDPWNFAGESKGTWGTVSDINNLIKKFSSAKEWSETNHIPIILGEFGAKKFCDYNSRMKHYAAYVEQAVEHNFAFQAWDDGGDFRIYQRETGGWNEIKDILLDYSSVHPIHFDVENKNGAEVELSWNNRLNGCDSIFIHRGTSITNLEKIASVSVDSITYFDKSIEKNRSYYYKITSFKQDTVELNSYPQKVFTEYVSSVELLKDLPLRIYPNPTVDKINLHLEGGANEGCLKIYDLKGELKLIKTLFQETGDISLKDFESGIYILNFKTGDREYSAKIQKL